MAQSWKELPIVKSKSYNNGGQTSNKEVLEYKIEASLEGVGGLVDYSSGHPFIDSTTGAGVAITSAQGGLRSSNQTTSTTLASTDGSLGYGTPEATVSVDAPLRLQMGADQAVVTNIAVSTLPERRGFGYAKSFENLNQDLPIENIAFGYNLIKAKEHYPLGSNGAADATNPYVEADGIYNATSAIAEAVIGGSNAVIASGKKWTVEDSWTYGNDAASIAIATAIGGSTDDNTTCSIPSENISLHNGQAIHALQETLNVYQGYKSESTAKDLILDFSKVAGSIINNNWSSCFQYESSTDTSTPDTMFDYNSFRNEGWIKPLKTSVVPKLYIRNMNYNAASHSAASNYNDLNSFNILFDFARINETGSFLNANAYSITRENNNGGHTDYSYREIIDTNDNRTWSFQYTLFAATGGASAYFEIVPVLVSDTTNNGTVGDTVHPSDTGSNYNVTASLLQNMIEDFILTQGTYSWKLVDSSLKASNLWGSLFLGSVASDAAFKLEKGADNKPGWTFAAMNTPTNAFGLYKGGINTDSKAFMVTNALHTPGQSFSSGYANATDTELAAKFNYANTGEFPSAGVGTVAFTSTFNGSVEQNATDKVYICMSNNDFSSAAT